MMVTRYDITEPPGPRMSRCVVNGEMVYLAGLTAEDTTADISGQTRQVLERIDAYLARASTDKSKLLTAQIWLTDIGNLAAMNKVWNAWVDPHNPPARATVEAQLARPEVLVEIMVTATS